MSTPEGRALLLRLRDETQAQHLEAERRVRILDADATVDTYRSYLVKMLGFHAPLEARFAQHAALAASGFEPAARAKAGWLRADLRALDMEPQAERSCAALPEVGSLAGALGCAYVLEGSTLGGRYILKHLGGALPSLRGRATAFLEGHGAQTGAMWRRFGEVVSAALPEPPQHDEAVAAAQQTFSRMAAWLDAP